MRFLLDERADARLLRQPHAGVVLFRLGDYAELAIKIKYLHGSLHAILAVHPQVRGGDDDQDGISCAGSRQ